MGSIKINGAYMIPSREELATQRIEAEWGSLRAHLERGGLIVVAGDLDLLNVALSVTGDDSSNIRRWIGDGQLAKPSESQIRDWNADPTRIFTMLITSPYVLIQEQPTAVL
jgi:hypothetical protein